MDSGASVHITNDRSLLTEFREIRPAQGIEIGDRSTVDNTGIEIVQLYPEGFPGSTLELENI